MIKPFLVFTFLFLSIRCSQGKIKISNPNEFLSKSGLWCFEGKLNKCILFTKDSLLYINNLKVYNKVPYHILSFDSITNQISYTTLNDFELQITKEFFLDVKNNKVDASKMNGIPLSSLVNVYSKSKIEIGDFKLENGAIKEGEMFEFTNIKKGYDTIIDQTKIIY